jgi:hypothetical protein
MSAPNNEHSATAIPPSIQALYVGKLTQPRAASKETLLSVTINVRHRMMAEWPGHSSIRLIDATCLIDGDGGPYTFSRTRFFPESTTMVLEYDRSASTNPGSSADETRSGSSFVIECKLRDGDFALVGRALTGTSGEIGTVVLERKEGSPIQLPDRRGYVGKWKGQAVVADGAKVPLSITLENGAAATSNPASYEFDFTPGKICTVDWNGTQIVVDRVTIDYLNKRVECLALGPTGQVVWSLVYYVGSKAQDGIKGHIYSFIKGPVSAFELAPAK